MDLCPGRWHVLHSIGRPCRQYCPWYGLPSAVLRFVEAPGQHCYRKVVDVMIISTMHRICCNSKVKECSCCTNNTSYLSYCLQTRHVSTFVSSKVSDEIYFSFENERLPLQYLFVTIIRFVRCAISTFENEHLITL